MAAHIPPQPPPLAAVSARATTAADRLEWIDVLRGVALWGILVMNMQGFASSFYTPDAASGAAGDGPWWDVAAQWLQSTFFEGKFNGLYTLLFGMGLALQVQRWESDTDGPGAVPTVLLRRLGVLGVFGALHVTLLWGGDVLHIYACIGLFLLAIRRWPAPPLLGLVAGLMVLQWLHGILTALRWTEGRYRSEQALLGVELARDNLIYGQGSWWQGVALRTEQWVQSYSDPLLQVPLSWFWLALITTAVLGLWAVRDGWLQAGSARLAWLMSRGGLRALWLGLLLGVLLQLVGALAVAQYAPGVRPGPVVVLGWALQDSARVVLTLVYAAAVLRWCHPGVSRGWGDRVRSALARTGRMPLTLYLLQSLLGTFIFHGWGLGWWGSLGPAGQFGLACALYAGVLMPLAHHWLKSHANGPIEFLWRRWTYGRRTP